MRKLNLKNQGLILIFPHKRLLAAGGSHPCVAIEDPDEEIQVLLIVGIHGLAIKENARVSKALVLAAELIMLQDSFRKCPSLFSRKEQISPLRFPGTSRVEPGVVFRAILDASSIG